jgi:hypothetical protein
MTLVRDNKYCNPPDTGLLAMGNPLLQWLSGGSSLLYPCPFLGPWRRPVQPRGLRAPAGSGHRGPALLRESDTAVSVRFG